MSYPAQCIFRALSLVIIILAGFLFFGRCAQAQVTMRVFVDPHSVVSGGTIGFTYAGNKFVGSVQGDGRNVLYATDLDGSNVRVFAPGVSVPGPNPYSEHSVASSLGLGGFPRRDIYVGAGNGVMHISNDGTRSDVFVSGLPGPVDAIFFDSVGTFGNQMIVATEEGQIYRVDASGAVTLLASIGPRTEGLDIAPLGAAFGPFDGQLIVASENDGLIRAISPLGSVTVLNGTNPIPYPESVNFVPLDLGASGSPMEGLYGANFPFNIVKAGAAQFQPYKGDAIVRTEIQDQRISRVHWNGHEFEIIVIGYSPGQAEDTIFVTPSMIDPGPVCPSRGVDESEGHDWERRGVNGKSSGRHRNPGG